jgi:hypothetical protein
VRKVTTRFVKVIAITSSGGDCAQKKLHRQLVGGDFAMLKKLILTAALLFALAAGTAGVLQELPAAAREPCVVNLNCSPVKHIPAHLVSLPPVW